MSDANFPAWHADARLPIDRPFSTSDASRFCVSGNELARMVRDGSIRRVFRGVYVDASAPDSIEVRARALALAVPESAIVTDTTAAWLYGADVVSPSQYMITPRLNYYRLPDSTRVRRAGVQSGRRTMHDGDLRRVSGVQATTPLRTACNLGRSLHRIRALGALDALLGLGEFSHDQLVAGVERFRGHRGVVQLRALAPLADGSAESMNESALRLLWLDAGLPQPELQIPILDEWGRVRYRLDLGDSAVKYAAEFDGDDWHSTPEQIARDRSRRAIIRDEGWTIDVFYNQDLYAWSSLDRLRRGFERARDRSQRPAQDGLEREVIHLATHRED